MSSAALPLQLEQSSHEQASTVRRRGSPPLRVREPLRDAELAVGPHQRRRDRHDVTQLRSEVAERGGRPLTASIAVCSTAIVWSHLDVSCAHAVVRRHHRALRISIEPSPPHKSPPLTRPHAPGSARPSTVGRASCHRPPARGKPAHVASPQRCRPTRGCAALLSPPTYLSSKGSPYDGTTVVWLLCRRAP
jgi:hypothetical protein